MKWWTLISLVVMIMSLGSSRNAYARQEMREEGFFLVSGHLYDMQKEIGVKKGFLDKAIYFINNNDPDFLILTGDLVWAVTTNAGPRPVETIRAQYAYLMHTVFDRVKAKIYSVAGNHDTGQVPYPPAVELFEKNLNPLSFSFEHKGSLFLFLSIYQPFPHMEIGGIFSRFTRVWYNYDTSDSRALLDDLRNKVEGSYNHIFIFVHFSPLNEFGIGYYWSNFLIPFLSSLTQDIHIFSTPQLARVPLALNEELVVKYKNIRFYGFAKFPVGSYSVKYDTDNVEVGMYRGNDFVPAHLQEVAFQPTTRLSMLRSFMYSWFVLFPKMLTKHYWRKYTRQLKDILTSWYDRLFPKDSSGLGGV